MNTKVTAAIRRKSIPAAIGIAVLSGTLMGCADSAALTYTHEMHAQKVAAWCYTYSGARTAWLREDCVRRVWANVPPSQYWIAHNAKVPPCRCGTGSKSEMSAVGTQQETATPPAATVKPTQ
jgi:hypothetical protein